MLNVKLLHAISQSSDEKEVKEINSLLNDYRLLVFNILPKIDTKIDETMDKFRTIAGKTIKVKANKSKKLDKTEFTGKSPTEILNMVK